MVGGLRMHARVCTRAAPPGAGAIVFVHGLGVSGRYLIPTAREMAATHRVYVPDLPGSGRSDRPPRTLDISQLADALAAWMDAAGPAAATLVGNSLGCQTIIDFALRYPERIERAVLVGPTLDPRARSMARQILRGTVDLLREPFSYWPLLVMDYLIAGPLRTLRTLHYAVRDPLIEKLARVPVPMLVVRGDRDPIAPQAWAEQLARELPEGGLAVVAGAAHVVNYSAPRALAAAIRGFLPEATRTRSSGSMPVWPGH
jgi:2-hydroxy-6-oxonona-2,4-dienedioate hydrolase